MKYFYQFLITALLLLFVGIIQVGAWSGIIAQSGDILNLAKWNEMANMVMNSFTQSGNTFGTKAIIGTNDNHAVGIETNNSERISISSGGNVGINTTTPVTKLEIDNTTPNTSGVRFTRLSDISPTQSGNVATLGITSSGNVVTVPNGFPKVLTTTGTIANTSTTIYSNIPALQIPVIGGKVYTFKAYLVYNAAATTTGIRLRMTAPNNFWYSSRVNTSATALQYRSLYNNGATSLVSTASVGTVNNVAIIEGTMMPTVSGTGIIQFASEINGSAITLQANSVLYYTTY